jgi:hypothetical protein
MTTAYSTLLGLALPVQGELSGTWGDTVDNGITRYLDIAVAGTVTLTNDGAVTLSLTNGDASATNIVSSLTGAGTTSAQFAIIRVTGTLTVAKVLTAPSSSRTYVVVNAATGSTVTVKASGQTGVSIAVGETAFVYFNGTDYAKIVGTATAGAAGGSTTQVQYNNAGVLAGITGATTNGTALTLVAPNLGSPATVGTMPAFTLGGTVSGGGNQINNVVIGAVTPLAGSFTTLNASSTVTLSGGTTNGVAYLNGSKVLTTGTALTFDGTSLGIGIASPTQLIDGTAANPRLKLTATSTGYAASQMVNSSGSSYFARDNSAGSFFGIANGTIVYSSSSDPIGFFLAGTEAMRLTSTLLTVVPGATIQGLTVGLGAGAVSTNTAVGVSALAANTTGARNTVVGAASGVTMSTADSVTAVGYGALNANTGSSNTGIGEYALQANSSGANNTSLGFRSLYSNTTASFNTAVGYQAGYSNTTGTRFTAIGSGAGYYNNASYGVFVGSNAGNGNTGTQNTVVGDYALTAAGAGAANVAIGQGAMQTNTSGGNNTAVGTNALVSNTTASNNTAVGYRAGYANTTGTANTYIGEGAGFTNTASSYNTFVGEAAGFSFNTTVNAGNTFVGVGAGYGTTTGTANTFVGAWNPTTTVGCGQLVTTGSKNTILGGYNGNQSSLDIRTASNYIVLSDGDGNPRGIFDSSGNLLVGTTSTAFTGKVVTLQATSASDVLTAWNSATTGDNAFIGFYTEAGGTGRGSITYNRAAGLVALNTTSDYRAKDIIGPVTGSGALIDSTPVYMGKMKDATQERPMFIAHEVPAYAHTGEKDAVDKDGNPVYQQMDASALIPVMWAEIQSLRKRLAAAGIA